MITSVAARKDKGVDWKVQLACMCTDSVLSRGLCMLLLQIILKQGTAYSYAFALHRGTSKYKLNTQSASLRKNL